MQVIHGSENLPPFSKKSVIAIGNFDGIHMGHQKILKFLTSEAKKLDLFSLILTFSPHPEKILGKGRIKMIQTLEQRLREIKKFDVQIVLVLTFDRKFSKLSSQEFIQKIALNTLKAREIIVGENFHFGRNREGDIHTLRHLSSKLNFKVSSIPPVVINRNIISSSLIRRLLHEGKIEKANVLIGRPYEIEGTVIKGKSRGKALGFPTANIQTANDIIPSGVFITTVKIGSETFPSLTNVGYCPTFNQQDTNIESYIMNFNTILYGEKIRVHFIKKIRDEIKFNTPEKLAQQIKLDLQKAKTYFEVKSVRLLFG